MIAAVALALGAAAASETTVPGRRGMCQDNHIIAPAQGAKKRRRKVAGRHPSPLTHLATADGSGTLKNKP